MRPESGDAENRHVRIARRIERFETQLSAGSERAHLVRKICGENRGSRESERRVLNVAHSTVTPRNQTAPWLLVLITLFGVRAAKSKRVARIREKIEFQQGAVALLIERQDTVLDVEAVRTDRRHGFV